MYGLAIYIAPSNLPWWEQIPLTILGCTIALGILYGLYRVLPKSWTGRDRRMTKAVLIRPVGKPRFVRLPCDQPEATQRALRPYLGTSLGVTHLTGGIAWRGFDAKERGKPVNSRANDVLRQGGDEWYGAVVVTGDVYTPETCDIAVDLAKKLADSGCWPR